MEKNTNKSNKKKKKSKNFKTILIITAIIIGITSLKIYQTRKLSADRREAAQEQQEIMIESWKDQGLSDEEIEEKLKEIRLTNFDNQKSSGFGIVRMVTGGRGTGARK